MKSKMMFFVIVAIAAGVFSCSDDNEVKRKGDPDITHEGEKWTIASMDYVLTDQGLSGSSVNQTFREGTVENAGSFYFVAGGEKGSFEISVEGYNKEDFFNYTNDQGSVSIITVEQSVATSIAQNIVAISGETTATEMFISGTIIKQSMTGQFSLTLSNLTLIKD